MSVQGLSILVYVLSCEEIVSISSLEVVVEPKMKAVKMVNVVSREMTFGETRAARAFPLGSIMILTW